MNRIVCERLHRGQDLMESIKELAAREHLKGAVVLSAVGCVSRARLRDASGTDIQEIPEHCEIVSVTGTVSQARTHLHISLSRKDLSVLGGHLVPGCIVNTTCELVLMETGFEFGKEFDPQTGYHEILFREVQP